MIPLQYAVAFLVLAILSGVIGFGVITGTAAVVAKIGFLVFLVLFLCTLLGVGQRRNDRD